MWLNPIAVAQLSRLMTKPTKWHVRPAKTDPSFRCPHEDTLGPYLPNERTAKTLIRLGGSDLSLRWAHSHFVGFVMRRLNLRFIHY